MAMLAMKPRLSDFSFIGFVVGLRYKSKKCAGIAVLCYQDILKLADLWKAEWLSSL